MVDDGQRRFSASGTFDLQVCIDVMMGSCHCVDVDVVEVVEVSVCCVRRLVFFSFLVCLAGSTCVVVAMYSGHF